MQDTLALAEVVDALDNPIGRVIAKEKLVKAYYLMGRNMDDYCRDFSTTAAYYIEADRLKTKNPILCGRINSCMGYLCKQDSCFEEALEFYERSSHAFKEAGDEWYYVHNLLNVAECHISLHKYYEADSLLTIAEAFDIDSTYYARMNETRGLYFFERQEYAVLTFDDGYKSLKEVLAWLEGLQIPATLFINGKYLDGSSYRETRKEQYLTHDELFALTSLLIEIGHHGWEHKSVKEITEELIDSLQKNIEVLSAHPRYIPFWAYTYGRHDKNADAIMLQNELVPVLVAGNKNYNWIGSIDRELMQ